MYFSRLSPSFAKLACSSNESERDTAKKVVDEPAVPTASNAEFTSEHLGDIVGWRFDVTADITNPNDYPVTAWVWGLIETAEGTNLAHGGDQFPLAANTTSHVTIRLKGDKGKRWVDGALAKTVTVTVNNVKRAN